MGGHFGPFQVRVTHYLARSPLQFSRTLSMNAGSRDSPQHVDIFAVCVTRWGVRWLKLAHRGNESVSGKKVPGGRSNTTCLQNC